MEEPKYRRALVWSGWLRLSHACTGLAVLALLFSGWLIEASPSLSESALDVHYLAASFLIFGLVVRIVLFFVGKNHERLSALFPANTELAAMARTLRFYFSLGKSPLPGWYAQNPLWKPCYLVIYLALITLAVTGAIMPDTSVVLGFYVPSVHIFWSGVVLWFSILHIASVLMHDYKSQTTDISAMVNGYRLFLITGNQAAPDSSQTVKLVTPDTLKKQD